MNAIECECQLRQGQQPVACCGDFVCPTPAGATDSTVAAKSRVHAIRQLFEDKIQVVENLQSSRGNSSEGKSVPTLVGSSDQRVPLEGDTPQSMQTVSDEGDRDCAKFYRSHTKIISVPNGVKIVTTILMTDNLLTIGHEPHCAAYETLIYPESEIIKRFEREMNQTNIGKS